MKPVSQTFRVFGLILFTMVAGQLSWAEDQKDKSKLAKAELGKTVNVHSFNDILLCGQPTAEDFVVAKSRGIDLVITLRKKGEVSWDEPKVVKELGMQFERISFGAPPTLTDEVFDKSVALLKKNRDKSIMLHCGSANRVGAIWLVHRVINDGVSVEKAQVEAKTVGLRTSGFEERALQYIKKQAEK